MGEGVPEIGRAWIIRCCHPALATETHVALALRTLCGLTTEEIAHAFLIPVSTVAQRLVRAQKKIRDSHIPFEVPEGAELFERTDSVLAAIYLVFNEGYSASFGSEVVRRELCDEAIRLAELLCQLRPDDAEAKGLLALMCLHHSRHQARSSLDGGIILLDKQDRALWNKSEIEKGLSELNKALSLKACGAYTIQAAIAALHAQSESSEKTDWKQIVGLYDKLVKMHASPVVLLNRAAAVAMAEGAERGLALIDDLDAHTELRTYHLLYASRA